MVKRYEKGRRFEYQVRDYFADRGFWAMRSPVSKGVFDVIALKKGLTVLVQCKHEKSISRKERKEMLDIANWIDGLPVLAVKNLYDRLYPILFFKVEENCFLELSETMWKVI